MKGLNNINDSKPLDFFFEFLPQIVLMTSLFGYMDLLIVLKWLTDWSSTVGISSAPSIITIMIDVPLELGALVFFFKEKYLVLLGWRFNMGRGWRARNSPRNHSLCSSSLCFNNVALQTDCYINSFENLSKSPTKRA